MKAERVYREVRYRVSETETLPAAQGRTIQPDLVIIEQQGGDDDLPHVKVMGRVVLKLGLSTARSSTIFGKFSSTPIEQAPRWVRELVVKADVWP